MNIDSVEVGSLKFDSNNARKHDDKNLEAIKGSLKQFGQQKPIVVTKSGKVIAGNGTLQAAIALGWSHIDIVRTDLKNRDAMAYALADNRSAELAEWDKDILGATLRELEAMDFDVGSIGFDLDEFASDGTKEGLTDDDEIPETVENEFGVKLGDIWQLGNHRVMCGDSTKIEDVEKLMNGENADMVFTDPPYGMNLNTDYSTTMNGTGIKHRKIIGDDKYFDPSLILSLFSTARDIFLWGADYYCWSLPKGGSWIVWDKRSSDSNIGQLDGAFGSSFEMCWTRERHSRDIARVLRETGYFARGDAKKVHPTQKPVKLAEWFFEKWGKPNELVADLFLGSGSTLIACEKTNRKCYGMEIDPHYVSVIIKRWQDFTGDQATLLTGN
jgi:DNA modification methylase